MTGRSPWFDAPGDAAPAPEFELLRKAARKGDVAGLERALADDPDVVRRSGPGGATLLWEAAGAGRLEVVARLIEAGADVNARAASPFVSSMIPKDGRGAGTVVAVTPAVLARSRRRYAVSDLLQECGTQSNVYSHAFLGQTGALRFVLDGDPDLVRARDPVDDARTITPLHHAVCGGAFGCAKLLIERGAEVAAHARFLLTVAARLDRADLVELLLDNGAAARESCLLGPLDGDERPVADLLVARGFDVNDVPRWGPMLVRACRRDVSRNAVHRARVLLGYGADPNRADRRGNTALHYAVRSGDAELVDTVSGTGRPDNANA